MTPGTDVKAWRLPWHFVRSWAGATGNRRLLDGVERHCLFLGLPKSGHSLVGSLLDAHPEVVIAHELGALKYLHAGFGRRQIDWLALENSRRQQKRGRREGHNSYDVPGQWQGRFEKLRVVGDKHGEGMTLRLGARPWLLDRVKAKLPGLRLVIVVRNPYDIIASLTVPRRRRLDLAGAAAYFFDLCGTVSSTLARVPAEVVQIIRLESFISDPETRLEELCVFLGVDATGAYLRACRKVVFDRPRRTRSVVEWPTELRDQVNQRLSQYPFIADYSLDDAS